MLARSHLGISFQIVYPYTSCLAGYKLVPVMTKKRVSGMIRWIKDSTVENVKWLNSRVSNCCGRIGWIRDTDTERWDDCSAPCSEVGKSDKPATRGSMTTERLSTCDPRNRPQKISSLDVARNRHRRWTCCLRCRSQNRSRRHSPSWRRCTGKFRRLLPTISLLTSSVWGSI